MKKVAFCISMSALAFCLGCGSGNGDNNMNDDTVIQDTDDFMIDTSGVADTAGRDSMYRDSPARSDGSTSSSKGSNQRN